MDRKTIAGRIGALVTELRAGMDTVSARAGMAVGPGWYGRHRPDHYRRTTSEALETVNSISNGFTELIDLLAFYGLLWPSAHDDDLERPGYCACGRWAETCPARAAAAAGELTWRDHLGQEHPLDSPGSTPNEPADHPTPAKV